MRCSMRPMHSPIIGLLAVALACTIQWSAAAVEVRVEFDKAFDFAAVRTWGWRPAGAGEVKMARTIDDDPEAVRRQAEPWIVEAVGTQMASLGLVQADAAPDVTVTYYLLLSTNLSSQSVGDFLPAVSGWAVPPFAPATQSLRMMNRGSLLLDLTAGGTVVWRGLAQTQLRPDTDTAKKQKALREGVRDLLRRYPVRR